MINKFVEEFEGDISLLLEQLKSKDETYWLERGDAMVLRLFREMADRVPAYKDFLSKNKIKPDLIVTNEDLRNVPLVNKENYLVVYSRSDLCWDGVFNNKQWIVSSTSGSTRAPYYFPRTKEQDIQFSLTAEATLVEYFNIDNKTTLFVDCFALGVWIGGVFMYEAIKQIMDQKKYPLSMITPGSDKVEALKAIKGLGGEFDQIVIGGYAPLVKDLIADGIDQGLDWGEIKPKYFFAAEGFTEGFRDYLKNFGGAKNIFTDTINHYGTADLGTMAHETGATTAIRRASLDNEMMFDQIFLGADNSTKKLPTLAQYIPELFHFEVQDSRLVCSGFSGYPLCRYDLKDTGNVITFGSMKKKLASINFDLNSNLAEIDMKEKLWKLPFVMVYERADFTVSIYSVNIYPESVKDALETKGFTKHISGKFNMRVDFDENDDQFLEINIELRPNTKPSKDLKTKILKSIIDVLHKTNSEWRDFYKDPKIKDKIIPKVILRKYQEKKYFSAKIKQQWTTK